MFNKPMKIGEGEKYDVSKTASQGVSQEEIAEAAKKNKKLIDIYKAFDTSNGGSLDVPELALAMDGFAKADTDGDGKLSKKELDAMAQAFNEKNGLKGDKLVDGKDMKDFLQSIRKATKNDQKVSTQNVLDEQNKLSAMAKDAVNAFQKDMDDKAAARLKKEQADLAAKQEADNAAKIEAARIADLQTPKKYTVQENESLTSILKKSLVAQGKTEPTAEDLAAAKAEFIKNNPGALHGQKGKEYLYAGASVKVAGNLEDLDNGKEINDGIIAKNENKKAAAEERAKAEAQRAAEEEKQKQGLPPYAALPPNPVEIPKLDINVPDPFNIKKGETPPTAPAAPKAPVATAPKKEVPAEESKPDPKKIEKMNKYPLNEQLPNGYSRRDVPGYNDGYFDRNGNRITEQQYLEARGKKSLSIDMMVASPIMEQLPNGYTRRDTPGPTNHCYDKDGNRISDAEFQRAKKTN